MSSLPSRNKVLALALQNYTEADMEVFSFVQLYLILSSSKNILHRIVCRNKH